MVETDEFIPEDGQLFHTRKAKVASVPHALAPLADTHCHLTCLSVRSGASAVARAVLAGVRLFIVPIDAVDDFVGGAAPVVAPDVPSFFRWLQEQSGNAQSLLASYVEENGAPLELVAGPKPSYPFEKIRIIAGVHPYNAKRYLCDQLVRRRLEELIASPICVGVGEIGLDFGPYNTTDEASQLACFRSQLMLACDRNLPVELHIRDAKGDPSAHAHQLAADILSQIGIPSAGCDLHCFTGGPEIMEPFVKLGCHIAFGGALSFKRSQEIRAAALSCPSELLLCETDSPYMAPEPLRGLECEPAMVSFTAKLLADLREDAGVAKDFETYFGLWHNAHTFFGLEESL